MIADSLVTNEVKNSAGTEIEFSYLETLAGSGKVWKASSEAPNLKHRFSVRHTLVGTGVSERRRSALQFRKEVAGVSLAERAHVVTVTVDVPIGDIADYTDTKHVMAEAMSFLASLGASTTILYDCTGNGAAALVNGTL
jgi:hypothetical protein